jgi:hypothetical protein
VIPELLGFVLFITEEVNSMEIATLHTYDHSYRVEIELQDLEKPTLNGGYTQAWVVTNCDNFNLIGSKFYPYSEDGKNYNIGNRAYWIEADL